MPKFRNGLAKVGRYYHFNFEMFGRSYHGSTRCEHRSAAEMVLQKKREDLALQRAGVVVLRREVPTLAQTLEDWTRAQAGAASERHILNVGSAIQLHLQKLLPLPLDQLTNQVVEDARTAYLGSKGRGHRPGQEGEWELGHTVGGANKVVQHLSSVVGWAVGRKVGGLEKMPFKLKPLKAQEAVEPVLWPEQVQNFLQQADAGHKLKIHAFPHSSTAMRMMLQLGLREAEARGARWEWLDRRRQVYVVGQAKSREVREMVTTSESSRATAVCTLGIGSSRLPSPKKSPLPSSSAHSPWASEPTYMRIRPERITYICWAMSPLR